MQLRNTLRKDFQEQGLDHLLPWSCSNNAALP